MHITFLRIRLMCMCILLITSVTFSMIITTVGGDPAPTKLYVDPPETEYWPPALGETFKVNVSVADVSDLKVIDFKLYWNTTLLDCLDAEVHPFLPPMWWKPQSEINETLGRYWQYINSSGDPTSGSEPLVTLTFNITYEPVWPENATCLLDLADNKLFDSNEDLIPHDVYDGKYSYYSNELLSITTVTDKPWYWLMLDTINVYGNLTLGYSLVPDGLVALEIDDPTNQIIRIRTLSTGIPPENQTVEIVDVIPCGDDYVPRSWFYRGYMAYFNVTVKNNDSKPRSVLVVINIYDANSTPLSASMFTLSVSANGTKYGIVGKPIPDTASLGDAQVYVSALSGLPRVGGTAYCPEEPASFEIRGSGAGGTASLPENLGSGPEGTYDFTFRLGLEDNAGNYTIYTNSNYTAQGFTQKATNNVTFEVKVTDLNGDGKVSITDVVIAALAFGSEPGDPNWNPIADVNGDEKITITDIVIVALHFGWSGS